MKSTTTASLTETVACVECDLLVYLIELSGGDRAACPRCGHLITVCSRDGLTRSLAYALSACVLLLVANAFPFLAVEAKGLEKVMTLPGTALELYRDGHATLAVVVLGPIAGVPLLMLGTMVAVLVPLRRRRATRWLVSCGRLLSVLEPWSMVEVFVIGVLVSLVKIGAMASVVIGLSF